MQYGEVPQDVANDIQLVDLARRQIVRRLLNVANTSDLGLFLPKAQAVDAWVLANIDQNEIIPTATGMAGAKPLERDRWLMVGSVLMQALTVLQSIQQSDPMLMSDTIGINAQ